MTRNLKVLGLALFAVMAMSAVVAGSASAAFTSEFVPVTVTGKADPSSPAQKFQYQAEGVTVTCSKVSGDGTQSTTPTSEVTTTPKYEECSTALGPADVSFGSCDYKFTSATGSTNISVHIECGATPITITVTDFFNNSLCTLTVSAQTPGGTITGTNVGSGTTREITIHSAVTGIHGTRNLSGSSLCGPLESSTGTYSGDVISTGESPTSLTHIGIDMD